MPLQATSGAASYDAFGGGVAAVPNYIEEVFSTYLYTGNGSTQTITNGIDLAGKGGLVWAKNRSSAGYDHVLTDTIRGAGNILSSNNTAASQSLSNTLTAFGSTGFTLGSDPYGIINYSGQTYVSWTFRKQPKFFDVVTYTGNGAGAGQTINHNLGSVPGFIICKATSTTGDWAVCARTGVGTYATGLSLNSTGAALYSGSLGNAPTATTFSTAGIFDNPGNYPNVNGVTYVAYLFAHNAGGFGLTGTDNVISCGSYTGNGSATGPVISLGYEPQWIMIKRTDSTGDWVMFDNMRGLTVGDGDAFLFANTSAAESTGATRVGPNATGFYLKTVAASLNASGGTYIYIAIRRGPMKVPTSGTSVFSPIARTGTGSAATVSTTNLTDMSLIINRDHSSSSYNIVSDRLRGPANTTSGSYNLTTNDTVAEYLAGTVTGFNNNNVTLSTNGGVNASGAPYINYFFSRAPSFFDEVCYTGTGATQTLTHNLTVAPELMIVKKRNASTGINWSCYHVALGNTQVISLNEDIQAYTSTQWNNTTPTASVFSVGTQSNVNASGSTYVAYLFASCSGVSKVGSYTGTGTTQQVNCGFTGGARFVLIKRTDEVASGNPWYVWDSARGIVAGNDPYLLLNSTAAEVTNTDYVDTYSAGFEISSTAPAAINASGGTYIYLAIA